MIPSSRRLQRRFQSLLILAFLFFLVYTASNLITGDKSSGNSAAFSPWTETYGKGVQDEVENGNDGEKKFVPEKKELVVASMAKDDVRWLEEFFGDWKRNVYVVDDESASLTVPRNKGREAMPFLTYVNV